MNCPNCGNSLTTKGKYCPYCGTLIPEDVLVRIETRHEILDHGHVADAKKEIRKTEERTHRKRYGVIILAILVIGFVAALSLIIFAVDPNPGPSYNEKQHDENLRLQKIEDEILKYIKEGKYEQAYVMAGMLNYKADDISSYKEQWDQTRTQLEERLLQLMEEDAAAPAEH